MRAPLWRVMGWKAGGLGRTYRFLWVSLRLRALVPSYYARTDEHRRARRSWQPFPTLRRGQRMKIGAIAAVLSTVAGSVLALSWACGSSTPTAPTKTPPAKIVNSVQISGPASIAPGATAQLSAIATYVDGSTSDVTAVARWNSFDTKVLSISGSGLATGIKSGETKVQGEYANRGSGMTIRVLPDGTYRLAGTLTESGLPIEDATVAITAGQGTGLSATSDSGGGYLLYGVAGTVEIQVSKAGYTSQSRTLIVTADAVASFQLTTVTPAARIAGAYLLTFTAGRCLTPLTPA